MTSLDLMTTLILFSAVCYAATFVCIITGVLRPLLTAAINGLVDLARLAAGGADGRGKRKAHVPS